MLASQFASSRVVHFRDAKNVGDAITVREASERGRRPHADWPSKRLNGFINTSYLPANVDIGSRPHSQLGIGPFHVHREGLLLCEMRPPWCGRSALTWTCALRSVSPFVLPTSRVMTSWLR